MRIYSLTLQAIGPFAGRHTVDFAALGRSGLFLLEGPTGAGKSTLIDAVVFALYGGLAGTHASKQRLHSHHAPDGVEPFVDLVFEVEAGLFRVRRSPAHQRPKRRGDGFTPVNEQVVLTRLADVDRPDDGVAVSTRTQEVGDEIKHLVGLDRSQFLQTVVLPQGEFATFLRSSGEDRKQLLERIFRTDVYEQMTAELVERRRAAKVATERAEAEVESATRVVAGVAEVEVADVDPAALRDDADRQQAETAEAVATCTAALTAADDALREVEAIAEALRRRTVLLDRGARLDAEQPAHEARVEQVALARRAALVLPHRDAAAAARADLVEAEQRHTAAVAAAPAGLDAADCDIEIDRLTADVERFADLAVLEAGFDDREAALTTLTDRRAALADETAELEARRAARPAARTTLVERVASLTERLADRGALTAAVQRAEAALVAAQRAAASEVDLAQRAALVRQLSGDATSAVQLHADLRQSRINGMAGELASRLVVGEACMVCGSDAHPHPATRSDAHPDEDAVDTAERTARGLEASLAEAVTAHDVLAQEVTHLRDQAGGLDVEAATRHLDMSTTALAALDDVEAERADVQAEIDELDVDAETDRAVAETLAARSATADEQIRGATESLAADRATVAEATGTEPLTLVVQRLEAERAAVRRLGAAAASLDSAGSRAEAAAGELADRLAEHGFDDVAEVGRAAVGTAELERLEHQVQTHRDARSRVAEGLSDPAVAALTGDETPDVESAAATRAATAIEHEAAIGRAQVAERRRRQVLGALATLSAATAALAAVQADARAVVRLAGLADASSPENLKKLTLGTYVLLRRFADVVEAANERLAPMSDGRYRLRVSDEREKTCSGRRTGLALSVIDQQTGVEREPKTLSGGETFYVSLSLALGLADVVSAESGGVRLGTLFVDEGFGSLDAETLDDVMAELAGLATDGGRTVGLVSHVEELKQRVADRITVRRLDDGVSTLDVRA